MRFRLSATLLLSTCAFSLAAPNATLTVAPKGGDFTTVQAAIDAAAKAGGASTIVIKPGTYKEKLKLDKKVSNVTLRGDGRAPSETLLTFDDWAQRKDAKGKEIGTRGSASVAVEGSDITFENLTIANTAGDVGQAVALRTQGDRLVFRNVRLLGWQDTLYANDGRSYYDNCYVEGRVDFIFGRGVAVFDHCEIKSKNGGYVTAASTNEKDPYGYVFLDCKLTQDPRPFNGNAGNAPVPTYLGRPWRAGASVSFVRCVMGPHIRPEGWSEWKDEKGQPKSARYGEYECTGPGAKTDKRVSWSKQLPAEEAKQLTVENVLAGNDKWNPKRDEK